MPNDDEDFAAMFAESEAGKPRAKRPKIGDVLKGKVISIGKESVFVDLGSKAEGQLERSQVSDSDGHLREPFDLFDRHIEKDFSLRPRIVDLRNEPRDSGRWLSKASSCRASHSRKESEAAASAIKLLATRK